jgi:hypothetical protein
MSDGDFRQRLLAEMRDPEFAHAVWESIRVVEHQREMERTNRWVQKWRDQYNAMPWWRRMFATRPL